LNFGGFLGEDLHRFIGEFPDGEDLQEGLERNSGCGSCCRGSVDHDAWSVTFDTERNMLARLPRICPTTRHNRREFGPPRNAAEINAKVAERIVSDCEDWFWSWKR
jgi:hypothetical protein